MPFFGWEEYNVTIPFHIKLTWFHLMWVWRVRTCRNAMRMAIWMMIKRSWPMWSRLIFSMTTSKLRRVNSSTMSLNRFHSWICSFYCDFDSFPSLHCQVNLHNGTSDNCFVIVRISHIFCQDKEKTFNGGGVVRGSALHNPSHDRLWYWRGIRMMIWWWWYDDSGVHFSGYSYMQIVHMIGCDIG